MLEFRDESGIRSSDQLQQSYATLRGRKWHEKNGRGVGDNYGRSGLPIWKYFKTKSQKTKTTPAGWRTTSWRTRAAFTASPMTSSYHRAPAEVTCRRQRQSRGRRTSRSTLLVSRRRSACLAWAASPAATSARTRSLPRCSRGNRPMARRSQNRQNIRSSKLFLGKIQNVIYWRTVVVVVVGDSSNRDLWETHVVQVRILQAFFQAALQVQV